MKKPKPSNAEKKRFWGKVKKGKKCWIWKSTINHKRGGYGQFAISGVTRRAHRIAWEISKGPIPKGYCVCHKCDNPPCVNPSHLFLGTILDNMRDSSRKGRMHFGEKNGNHKLKIDQVREIKKKMAPVRDLANKFGVKTYAIYKILSGKRWANV